MLMLPSVHVTRVLFLVLAGNSFCPDYGLLLELHALTLVACSYALLIQDYEFPVAASETPLLHILGPCPAVTGHLADVESWCLEGFPMFLYHLPMECIYVMLFDEMYTFHTHLPHTYDS